MTLHIVIIITLIVLTYLLYGEGFGAVPFLLAAVYLLVISWIELKRTRSKRKSQ